MASIHKRKSKDGKSFVWRVVVRVKGFPTACKTFERKQEAEDWAIVPNVRSSQGNLDMARIKNSIPMPNY